MLNFSGASICKHHKTLCSSFNVQRNLSSKPSGIKSVGGGVGGVQSSRSKGVVGRARLGNTIRKKQVAAWELPQWAFLGGRWSRRLGYVGQCFVTKPWSCSIPSYSHNHLCNHNTNNGLSWRARYAGKTNARSFHRSNTRVFRKIFASFTIFSWIGTGKRRYVYVYMYMCVPHSLLLLCCTHSYSPYHTQVEGTSKPGTGWRSCTSVACCLGVYMCLWGCTLCDPEVSCHFSQPLVTTCFVLNSTNSA